MDERDLILTVDTPDAATLRLSLRRGDGTACGSLDVPLDGYVDNLLLTAVDKLLKKHTMDRFALSAVQAGAGIDKNSSLYRIVKSFAAALAASMAERR